MTLRQSCDAIYRLYDLQPGSTTEFTVEEFRFDPFALVLSSQGQTESLEYSSNPSNLAEDIGRLFAIETPRAATSRIGLDASTPRARWLEFTYDLASVGAEMDHIVPGLEYVRISRKIDWATVVVRSGTIAGTIKIDLTDPMNDAGVPVDIAFAFMQRSASMQFSNNNP